MPVKENHKTLYKKMACFFNNPASATLFEAQFRTAEEVTEKRGRIEVRTIKVSAQMPQKYTGFAGMQQVFQLTRKVTYKKSGQLSEETVFGMTSLGAEAAKPEHLLALTRGHWSHKCVAVDDRESQPLCTRCHLWRGCLPRSRRRSTSGTRGTPQRLHQSAPARRSKKHSRTKKVLCRPSTTSS